MWPVVAWSFVFDHLFEYCTPWLRVAHILHLPLQSIAQFIMLFRAYAFTGRSRQCLALLGTVYLCLIAVNLWAFSSKVYRPPKELYDSIGKTGCFPDYGMGIMALRVWLVVLFATVMDAFSLSVVLWYCRLYSAGRGAIGRIFVQQGLIYFAILLAGNLVCVAIYFSPMDSVNNGAGLAIMFPVSNIIACRIIIVLRKAAVSNQSGVAASRRSRLTLTIDEWAIQPTSGSE